MFLLVSHLKAPLRYWAVVTELRPVNVHHGYEFNQDFFGVLRITDSLPIQRKVSKERVVYQEFSGTCEGWKAADFKLLHLYTKTAAPASSSPGPANVVSVRNITHIITSLSVPKEFAQWHLMQVMKATYCVM
jgi:hypothetical protein